MDEAKYIEYRVLKEGENLICITKQNPDGSTVLHIPGEADYSNLIDFEDYIDQYYRDE